MAYDMLAGIATIDDAKSFLRTIDDIAATHNVTIQAVDAEKIADKDHVDYAVQKALRSFEEGRNIAKDLGLEILLYISARRHIRRALDFGIHEGTMHVLFVVVGGNRSIKKALRQLNEYIESCPDVLEYSESKRPHLMQAFDITDKEVDAVGGPEKIPKLVRERVVLFNAFK